MVETLSYDNKEALCKAIRLALSDYRCFFHNYVVCTNGYEYSEVRSNEALEQIEIKEDSDKESGGLCLTFTSLVCGIDYPDSIVSLLETGNGIVIQQHTGSGHKMTWTILHERKINTV